MDCVFKRKKGQVALDQIRSIDKVRLVKKLGSMDEIYNRKISEVLWKTSRIDNRYVAK